MDIFDTAKFVIGITLHNSVVYPGNVVHGTVSIKAAAPAEAVAIRLKIVGKEKLQRRAVVPGSKPPVADLEVESHCVHKQLLTLWGQLKDGGNRKSTLIPKGEYSYPFAFALPLNVPCSFRSEDRDDKAVIVYYAKAYVDITMGHDAKKRVPFYVLSTMPARQWIDACPMTVDRSWDITRCGCLGSQGHIGCRIAVDRTVFALDRDCVVATMQIDCTRAKVKVEQVTMRVIHKCRMRINNQSAYIERVAATASESVGVQAGESGTVTLTVPFIASMSPPSLQSQRIQSTYELQVALDIPSMPETCQSFAALLGYTVDSQNLQMPINTNACVFPPFDETTRKEYLYHVPSKPLTMPALIAAVPYATTGAAGPAVPGQPTTCPYPEPPVHAFPEPTAWGEAAAGGAPTQWQLPSQPLRTVERGLSCAVSAVSAATGGGAGRGGADRRSGAGSLVVSRRSSLTQRHSPRTAYHPHGDSMALAEAELTLSVPRRTPPEPAGLANTTGSPLKSRDASDGNLDLMSASVGFATPPAPSPTASLSASAAAAAPTSVNLEAAATLL